MEQKFEARAQSLAATLGELFRHRGTTVPAKVLQFGQAELRVSDYDNWNGGTTTYSFVVRVPIDVFAELGNEQDAIEKAMHQELGRLLRMETHHEIGDVVIVPEASLSSDSDAGATQDGAGIWPAGTFRLFLSHVSAIKERTHRLKMNLRAYGVSGFVAHDDIEPTRDWQNVIEAALRTMDALAALVDSNFPASRWCDQEVGIAIGRGRLVVPVRLGVDPYGFMGRYQGVQGKGLTPEELASRLVTILMKHERTSRRLAEAMLRAFASPNGFEHARTLIGLLERFDELPLDVLREVKPALKSNAQLRDAYTVPERFRKLLVKHGVH